MLNVYKISGKKHQLIDFWVSDEMSALEILFWKYLSYIPLILRNYKKLKAANFFMILNFFYFKCTIISNDNFRVICIKMQICLLNITFLHKFLHRITIWRMKSLFLQQILTRKTIKISFVHQIWAKGWKIFSHWNKKGTLTFNNSQNLFFSNVQNFTK